MKPAPDADSQPVASRYLISCTTCDAPPADAVAYLVLGEDEAADDAKAELRKYAESFGVHLVGALIDREGGETPLLLRPAFKAVLAKAARLSPPLVIVRSAAELSLSPLALARVVVELLNLGHPLLVGDVLLDARDGSTRGWAKLLGVAAPVEEAPTPSRAGRAPYGTTYVGGRWMAVPSEQLIIDRMVDLHQEGLALRRICIVLEEEGHRPRLGEHWHAKTVRDILMREKAKLYADNNAARRARSTSKQQKVQLPS